MMPKGGGKPVGDGEVGGTIAEFGWNLDADEVRRQARGLELLSMFHCPLGRSDGSDHFVESWGAKVVAFDLEIDLGRDLADDASWTKITDDISESRYAGGGTAMPCGTFSAARSY